MQSSLLVRNLVCTVTTKGKNGKFHPRTDHEGPQP